MVYDIMILLYIFVYSNEMHALQCCDSSSYRGLGLTYVNCMNDFVFFIIQKGCSVKVILRRPLLQISTSCV